MAFTYPHLTPEPIVTMAAVNDPIKDLAEAAGKLGIGYPDRKLAQIIGGPENIYDMNTAKDGVILGGGNVRKTGGKIMIYSTFSFNPPRYDEAGVKLLPGASFNPNTSGTLNLPVARLLPEFWPVATVKLNAYSGGTWFQGFFARDGWVYVRAVSGQSGERVGKETGGAAVGLSFFTSWYVAAERVDFKTPLKMVGVNDAIDFSQLNANYASLKSGIGYRNSYVREINIPKPGDSAIAKTDYARPGGEAFVSLDATSYNENAGTSVSGDRFGILATAPSGGRFTLAARSDYSVPRSYIEKWRNWLYIRIEGTFIANASGFSVPASGDTGNFVMCNLKGPLDRILDGTGLEYFFGELNLSFTDNAQSMVIFVKSLLNTNGDVVCYSADFKKNGPATWPQAIRSNTTTYSIDGWVRLV